ncbi:uncharacterized protein LOC130806941 [Amaranthus tricolor]|uniref:uncharacterized protein LOC130806941 n=1 Tax=Amaranthus tricolor TaxID=29722 RepID=UPI002588B3E6|nr:uncharacterized protein LOC130806941 [Amaranthus tricolor]
MTHKHCFEPLDRSLHDVIHCRNGKPSELSFGGKVVVFANVDELQEFTYWVLKVGDEKIGRPNNGEATIDIPEDLLIKVAFDTIAAVVDCIYPGICEGSTDRSYFKERAILTPTNEIFYEVNEHVLSLFPGEGVPNYNLLLKVGAPIMMLKNMDQSASLCNGTRLLVDHLGDRII